MDASYFRTEDDRLYLTGVEIAALIATGIVTSFLLGVCKGAKKKIGQYGEKIGEQATQQAIDGLVRLRDRLKGIDTRRAAEVLPQVGIIQDELDKTINPSDIQFILGREDESTVAIEIEEVQFYLKDVGYPDHLLRDRAEEMAARVRREFVLTASRRVPPN